eukprot:g13027.t1
MGGVFKHRIFALSNFGRKAALSKEEGSGISDVARDEENFRNGLKRNIAQLSNLARVNKEELVRLREQKKAIVKARLRNVVAYGNMAVKASRLAAETRQRLKKATEEPSEQDRLQEEMAVAAMGASHTEQQLLRASRLDLTAWLLVQAREIRGQLERALQEAEALRADNVELKSRANTEEKGKIDLEARVARLSDEVKLQTAPLTALRLELTQARSDTEMMRQRLKEERRESRVRVGDLEKASVDAKQRIERLEFDLNETTKALQGEILKASTFEGATKVLHEEVEQRKADAKRIAQELTRIQMKGHRPVGLFEDEETASESLVEQQQQAVISTLKASIAKLHLDKAKYDDAAKELQKLRGEAEERDRALKEAKERAESYCEENTCLRLAAEKQEEEQRQRDQERHDREVQHENETRARNLQSRSLRARLCRTLDELSEAEEAGELAITCLECAKLFKDPHVMAPCGHTLCADCSRRGNDGGGEPVAALKQSDERGSGWVLGVGGGGGDTPPRAKHSCPVCVKQEGGGGATERSTCVGSAPSRELATLVTKFVFRRQLLASLKDIGALLWQEDSVALQEG